LEKRSFFWFWTLFILLNVLLYFHNGISFLDHQGLLQGPTIDAGSWTGRMHMMFVKNKYYLFLFSGEVLLILSLMLILPSSGKWFRRFFYTFFIFLFVYNIYFEFNQKFYGIVPSFRNDYVLLNEVLPIFLNSLTGNATLSYLFAILFVLLTGSLFVFLLKKLIFHFEKIKSHWLTRSIFAGLWLFVLMYTFANRHKLAHQKILAAHWGIPNIWKSTQLEGADKYKKIETNPYEKHFSNLLAKQPNIYLLFIESYGTVATESKALKDNYLTQISSLSKRLEDKGYHAASTYSLSPVKGGRSWFAFSSFMSGLKVENQIQYNDLIQKHYDYPNMVSYFNHQGYQTYRLSTMSNVNADSLIPYARTNRYWGFDEWWTYQDFNYEGYHYDALGGIPDQYALGYFRDIISTNTEKPSFLFYITMASHMPWFEPPPILKDWRAFNQIHSDKPADISGTDLDRYEQSIAYEMELMTQFIESAPDSNSIFILIGDHQPPGMEHMVYDKTPDAATPLHVISQDSTFVNRFRLDGFQKGLKVDLESVKYLGHEDFYGLLLKHLETVY